MKIWGAGTTRTFRPIWVAEELGLRYTHYPIGPRTGETQTRQFTELNPKQKVPYLVDGEFGLSESIAMSRYLISKYGSSSTIAPPATVEQGAREDEWVSYFYGELDETSLYVMRRHGDLAPVYGEAPDVVASCAIYATKHLHVTANHLKGRQFVLGEALGLADVVLVSCLDWADHYGIELPEPLGEYRQRLAARPAYQTAFANNYGDLLGGQQHGTP